MNPKFLGKVQFGRLELEDQDAYDNYLLSLEGEVEVVVKKRSNKRTMKQNQYYWGVVIKLIADETGHSSDEIHEMMKRMFLKDLITIKGEEYETVKSSTELDTLGFSKDYIERIRMWAFDKLSIVIPDPDTIE